MTTHFAHRGSLTEAPENTIPSFERALNRKTRAIELDVQLSKDGELVICHDQRINRVAKGKKGFIKDFTLAELKQMDLGASFSEEYEGTSFATLEEVLAICPPDILLNIEIKNTPIPYEGIEKKVMDCLKGHKRMDNVIISSLDHLVLKRIRELNAGIKIGMLFQDRILEPWDYAQRSGLDVYSLHPRYLFVDETYVKKSHEAGLYVYPWTVDGTDDLDRLLKAGVDGVFTNNPGFFGTTE
ncbi:MAG TPA: glycerophosphodiester phosphodiesterase family protein [Bacillales bacterium]|nr:glycerophosphodiester phosphodiesterase family protein [Bacillales bacterium]